MSKPYKIFGSRAGIQTTQGRNAQLPMSMYKKPESTNQPQNSQRQQISPFSGYNASQYQSSLAHSQVSDPIMNQQMMKRMIREELQKYGSLSRNKNQINIMRTQIRSVKQYIQQLGQKTEINLSQFERIEGNLREVMTEILDNYKIQSAKNLREVVKKINENVRKQCIGHLANQYVPLDFVDEMQKQFGQLEDRISLLQSKSNGNRARVHEDPIVLAQTVDLRLKKMQRQFESLKKHTSDSTTKFKQIDETIQALKRKQQQYEQIKLEQQQKLNNKIKSQNVNLQKDIKKIYTNIEQFRKQNATQQQKIKNISEQLTSYSGVLKKLNSGQSVDIKDFLNNSKNLAYSSHFQKGNSSQSREVEDNGIIVATNPPSNYKNSHEIFKSPQNSHHKDLFQSPSKNSSQTKQYTIPNSPNIQLSSPKLIPNSPENQLIPKIPQNHLSNTKNDLRSPQKSIQKMKQLELKQIDFQYRIDSQNRLLDEKNSYILDEAGNIVTLTDQQLNLLRKSTLVKLQQ